MPMSKSDYFYIYNDQKQQEELNKVYDATEKRLKPYYKENEKYLDTFKIFLEKKKLGKDSAEDMLSHAVLYIDNFLNYYGHIRMEDGMSEISNFFEKWIYEIDIDLTDISLKKYQKLCKTIKNNMSKWIKK